MADQADQHAESVARPWWWNDPETVAWMRSGACRCRACDRARRLMAEAGHDR